MLQELIPEDGTGGQNGDLSLPLLWLEPEVSITIDQTSEDRTVEGFRDQIPAQ